MNNGTLGFALALTTAIGCISYAHLVRACGLAPIVACKIVGAIATVAICSRGHAGSELASVFRTRPNMIHAAIFLAAEVTTVLWFVSTARQGIAVSALWEVCYLPLLILMCWLAKDAALTPGFLAGSALVMAGLAIILCT